MNGLAELGGFAGLAALITAAAGVLVQLRSLRKVREDTAQLQPNHGSSLADEIARQGHEITHQSEKIDLILRTVDRINESADQTHGLISDRLHMHDIELRDIKKQL